MKHPLETPVQYVKGVGPVLAQKLVKLGVFTVYDLLQMVPHRYVDRRNILPLDTLAEGKDQSVKGIVVKSGISFLGRRRKRIYEVVLEDDSGARVSGKWFHFKQQFMQQKFALGTEVLFSGDVSRYGKQMQFIHPESEVATGEAGLSDVAGKILPIYPLTEGLYQKTLRKIIRNAWDVYGEHIEAVLPEDLIETHNLADPWTCLQELHFPAPDCDAVAFALS